MRSAEQTYFGGFYLKTLENPALVSPKKEKNRGRKLFDSEFSDHSMFLFAAIRVIEKYNLEKVSTGRESTSRGKYVLLSV